MSTVALAPANTDYADVNGVHWHKQIRRKQWLNR